MINHIELNSTQDLRRRHIVQNEAFDWKSMFYSGGIKYNKAEKLISVLLYFMKVECKSGVEKLIVPNHFYKIT